MEEATNETLSLTEHWFDERVAILSLHQSEEIALKQTATSGGTDAISANYHLDRKGITKTSLLIHSSRATNVPK